MRKYFLLAKVNEKNDKLIFDSAINNSINVGIIKKLNDNKFLLFNKDYPHNEINIGNIEIELNKSFSTQLQNIIFQSLDHVKNTPTSIGYEKGHYYEKEKGRISSEIHTLITRWHHNIENIDILDLAIDLMIRISRSQIMSNGNKRLSLFACSTFLLSVGLYLKFSYDKKYYLEVWEDLITSIAYGKYGKDIDEIKSNNNIDFNKRKMSIRDIFLESLYLSRQWHTRTD